MASRPIPPRPSLEFDRKQARALLDAVRHGDADAVERLRAHHPRFRGGTPMDIALHDAQLVIAREYGFASWPRWKQLVEAGSSTSPSAPGFSSAPPVGRHAPASTLLDAEPALERFDFYTACVSGAEQRWLGSSRAIPPRRRRGGPLDREPILYACSRASCEVIPRGRRDPARRPAPSRPRRRRQRPRPVITRGGVVDTDEPLRSGGHRQQPELTRMLLAAGADVNELHGEPGESAPSPVGSRRSITPLSSPT